ncbi:MAG TPA: D-2-hydroxyacid dehydrogenase [Geobacteraceae bacterium]
MNIVVLDGYTVNPGDNPWDLIATMGKLTIYDRTPVELLMERAREATVLLTNKTPLTTTTIRQLPHLRFISVLATGFNVVDIRAAGEQGVPVANVPEYSSTAVAQHAFALILELTNAVGLHDTAVKRGEWSTSPDFSFWKTPLVELAGKNIGIVGFGKIGRAVARIAAAFGMTVSAYAPRHGELPPDIPVRWAGMDELFATADVISLHCPQTEENTGFIDLRLLALMKPDAFLINTARGALVNEADLAEALNNGTIGGAALDVVTREPIDPANPLLTARNCLITPHLAWAARSARRRLLEQTAANIAAFAAGRPVNIVNSEFLPQPDR